MTMDCNLKKSNMRDLLRNHCPKSPDKESFRGFDCTSFAPEYFPKYDETDPATGEWLGDLRCLLEPTALPTTTTARPPTQTTTFRFVQPTRDPQQQITRRTPLTTARQPTTAKETTTVPIVTVTKVPPTCPGVNGKKPTIKVPNKPCPTQSPVQTGRAQFVSYKGLVHFTEVN